MKMESNNTLVDSNENVQNNGETSWNMFFFALSIIPDWFWQTCILVFGYFGLRFFFRDYLKSKSKRIAQKLPRDVSKKIDGTYGKAITVGFFHPYCNAGGGGERVLWCAVKALHKRYDFVQVIVYTGDTDVNPKDFIKKAKDRFDINIDAHVHFIYLKSRVLVTTKFYPMFTLLGQSLGSMVLGLEALIKFTPDVYIDTMGYAFTLPLFKYLGGCKTCSYVHYPIISTDMLQRVNEREAAFNNAQYITSNVYLSKLKLIYYKVFARIYGWCGRCSDRVMVNSTWTSNHIQEIWNIQNPRIAVVYPPCNTKKLEEIFADENENGKLFPRQIMSVAQFRPEKNHSLQLNVFAQFQRSLEINQRKNYRLLLVGGCRNEGDEKRVKLLKHEAKDLGILKYVDFHLNVSYDDLLLHLAQSVVGIHTMKDEHFGIGVVDFMAGGLITLAHNSAGPKMDIVLDYNGERTGYLAEKCQEYVKALNEVFKMTTTKRYQMGQRAREYVSKRFSEDEFERRFLSETESLLN